MRRALTVSLIVIAGAAAMLPIARLRAWAAEGETWASFPVRYYVNPANTNGLSSTAVINAVWTAASAWPTQSAANVSFTYGGTTSISSAANDGVNAVMFRPELDGSEGATTYRWWDANNHLLDSDIVIWENDFQFFTGTSGCVNGIYLEDLLTHEFGHLLGLGFSTDPTATMYPTMPGLCLIGWRYLAPDDIAGIQYLYPPVAGQIPAYPSSLTVSQNASNPTASLLLSWSDNASNESGYRIERGVDGVSFAQIAQTGANVTSYSDSGLAAGTVYYYRALAFNGSGVSAYSNIASGQTQTAAQPPPSTSADGTLVPPATQIVDSAGAVWTLGPNQAILRNGASAAGGLGSKILWSGGVIYVLGNDSNWWKWTGGGWTNVGPTMPTTTSPPPPPTGTASADGTLVPPATQIVDSAGTVWTLGTNQAILRNGAPAAGGLGSKILWAGGAIYVLGGDSNWWKWTGGGWTNVGPTMPTSTTTPPPPTGTASADGTLVPPATQIVDNAGAVWTIGAGQAILKNGLSAAGGMGSKVLWSGGTIYVLGGDNNWWKWTGGGWTNVGPTMPTTTTTPPPGTASADGTLVPPATQIVDSASAVWTIGAGQAILRNGASAARGTGSKILWAGGTIYVLGNDSNWWQWTGAGWINVGPAQP